MDNNMMGERCGCKCHGLIGWGIVLVGLVFLLKEFNVLTEGFVAVAWPFLVILIGLKMAMKRMCKCCDGGKYPVC